MHETAEMKKFVAREIDRGNLEKAYEFCKFANRMKVKQSKKELSTSSNLNK